MTWVAVGVGVVGAGAGIYSANKSANAQKDASKQSTELQQAQYEQGLKEVAPFKELGIGAIPNLSAAANEPITPFAYRDPSQYLTNYFNSPEYQALNTQAQDQILRGASATGGLRSGSSNVSLANIAPTLGINALNRVNQQDATAYGINQGAKTDQFNRLYGLVNMGANVASGNQNTGTMVASQAGQDAMAAGQSQANAYQQQGQALSGLATDLGTAYLGNKMGLYNYQPSIGSDGAGAYTGSAYQNWVAKQGGKV